MIITFKTVNITHTIHHISHTTARQLPNVGFYGDFKSIVAATDCPYRLHDGVIGGREGPVALGVDVHRHALSGLGEGISGLVW